MVHIKKPVNCYVYRLPVLIPPTTIYQLREAIFKILVACIICVS
jgi:hypothetical protein